MRHTSTLLTLLGITGLVLGWVAVGGVTEGPSADDPVEVGS
jgi:hypothetical protein